MSTKTTFKRIALVAVAALGLGVLSVAPSSAVVSNLTVTVADGTSSFAKSDSTTAATVNIAGLLEVADSVTVNVVTKSVPSGSVPAIKIHNIDSATPTLTAYKVESITGLAHGVVAGNGFGIDVLASVAANSLVRISKQTAAGNINHTFGIQLDTSTARVAGTYTYTVVVKAYNAGSTLGNADQPDTTITKDVSIVVAKAADASTTTSAVKSFATLTSGSSATTSNFPDSATTAVSTANGTTIATLYVALRNAENASAAVESLTATITGAGSLCVSSNCGKSFVIDATGDQTLTVRADGTAGVGTINLSTPTVTFAAKTVTFYAKAAKTITASVNNPVLLVGTNSSAIKATAVDANGTAWTGTLYVYASTAADALIGGSATTPVACSYDPTKAAHFCPVSTIAAGTANFKVIDASTVALATATSNEVAVKASAATAATVKLAFDKSSYAPFEKAIITVTPLDAAGATIGGQAFTGLLAAGGITSTYAFSSNSDTLTAVDMSTSADASSTAPRTAGSKTYVVYMPASGDVTISATGGVALAAAGRVAVSATASVVNSSVDAATDAANEATDAANAATDAALAAADAADAATAAAQDASDAVAALSATVAKLVASLKAQITSLTNLVIKIQKKVKA